MSRNTYNEGDFGPGSAIRKFLKVATDDIGGKQIVNCADGYIGIAPPAAQPGDEICVLLGCDAPLVLRPLVNGNFLVVGECFVHGLSKGEAFLGLHSLPGRFRAVNIYRAAYQSVAVFVDNLSGEILLEDPQFRSLPVDLSKMRERLAHDLAKISVEPDVLKKHGFDVKIFNLE